MSRNPDAPPVQIALRCLEGPRDFEQVIRTQRTIWSFPQGGIPESILMETFSPRGIAIGAFVEGAMVGFVISRPKASDSAVQFSYMVGVLPAWRQKSIGYCLKQHQRLIAAQKGVRVIESTFDPLQSVNACFHVHKLGVRISRYAEDFFLGSTSPLHTGTPTDRFVAEWPVCSGGKAVALVPPVAPRTGPNPESGWPVLFSREQDGYPLVESPLPMDRAVITVRIPHDFTSMQSEDVRRALVWRLETRRIFCHYLACGYEIVDFVYTAEHGTYVMHSPDADVRRSGDAER